MVLRETTAKMAEIRREADRKEKEWISRLDTLRLEWDEKMRDMRQESEMEIKELSVGMTQNSNVTKREGDKLKAEVKESVERKSEQLKGVLLAELEGRQEAQEKKQKKMKKHLKKVVDRLPGLEETLLQLVSTHTREHQQSTLTIDTLLSQTATLSKANQVLDSKLKKLQKAGQR